MTFGISDKKAVSHASLWLFLGQVLSQLLRLGSNLVLVRLLYPDAFGLMALMNSFLLGLQMCSDAGVSQRVIQSERGDDPEFLNTVWTTQAVRGILLCLISVGLAWPLSRFYGEPRLAVYLPVLGFCLLMAGFNATSLLTLRRHLQFKKLFLLDLAEQLAGSGMMILWACWNPSATALVAGSLTAYAVRLTGTHFFLGKPANRFHWDRRSARGIYDFGKWIFVSSGLTFLAAQGSRLLLGKLAPLEVLGIFSIAMMLATIPFDLASKFSEMVIFPLFSREARTSFDGLTRRVYQTRKFLWPLFMFAVLTLALGSGLFFHVFYPAAYREAGWMSQFLALWVWFSMLQMTMDRALLALGSTSRLALSNFVKLTVSLGGAFLGYEGAGMKGFILGLVGGAFAAYAVILFFFPGNRLLFLKQDLRYTFCGAGIVSLLFLLEKEFPSAAFPASLVVWGGVGVWTVQRIISQFLLRRPILWKKKIQQRLAWSSLTTAPQI